MRLCGWRRTSPRARRCADSTAWPRSATGAKQQSAGP